MAASITTTTPIRVIYLRFSSFPNSISGINFTTDETPQVSDRIGLNNGFSGLSNNERDNLDVLRQIYASNNGFRNAANESVIPLVSEFEGGTTIESLEQHGHYNPLDAESYNAWVERNRMDGDRQAHSTRTENAETELPGIESEISDVPVGRERESTTHTEGLSEWIIEFAADNQFRAFLRLESADMWGPINYKTHPAIRALVVWLNSIRTVGNEIPESTWSDFTGRRFSIEQSDGATPLEFFVSITSTGDLHANGSYSNFNIIFERSPINTVVIDIDALDEIIRDATPTINTVTNDMEFPERGSPDVEFVAKRLKISEMELVPVNNRELELWGIDENGRRFRSPLGGYAGRIHNFEDLPLSGGEREFHQHDSKDMLSFDAAADSILSIDNPSRLVRNTNTYRRYPIHNHSLNNTLELRTGWDDANLVTLAPGQSCDLFIILRTVRSGEVLVRNLQKRHLQTSVGNFSPTLADANVVRFSNSNDRFRMYQLYPESGNTTVRRDADTFRFGTGDSKGDTFDLNSHTDWNLIDVVYILKDGFIDVKANLDGDISGDGSIPTWNGLYLYRLENGSNTPVLEQTIKNPSLSAGDPLEYFLHFTGYTIEGDRFFLLTRSHASASINWANVNISRTQLDIILDVTIRKLWSI